MHPKLFPLLGITLLGILWVPLAYSQNTHASADACITELNKEVASKHRIFRAVLFGAKKAEDQPIGAVLYEKDGSAWYKVAQNEWRSLDSGFEHVTHYNVLIDERSEVNEYFRKPERKGIFETRRVTTSDLIPYIGQSLHAFQCQLYEFCAAVNASKGLNSDDPEELTVAYPGCKPTTRPSIAECHINARRPTADSTAIFQSCKDTVDQLLQQEADMIELAVQYDAAYRSLLQIAGSVDLFLQELHWPMTRTVANTTELLRSFHRIPCFLASCEAYPPPEHP